MTAAHIIWQVREAGGSIAAEHGRLRYRAPCRLLTTDFRAELMRNKAELLHILEAEIERPCGDPMLSLVLKVFDGQVVARAPVGTSETVAEPDTTALNPSSAAEEKKQLELIGEVLDLARARSYEKIEIRGWGRAGGTEDKWTEFTRRANAAWLKEAIKAISTGPAVTHRRSRGPAHA